MSPHQKDNNYWNTYYKENQHSEEIAKPSDFAIFCFDYLKNRSKILELGCGNGRDAEYFSQRHIVSACDLSEESIEELRKAKSNINYFVSDFTELKFDKEFDVVYSRFTLHSIDKESENKVLVNVHNTLKENGMFMIEMRSNYDELCGRGEKVSENEWIYNDHYRRFNILEDFLKRAKDFGFTPEYIQQAKDLAIFGDLNPVVIRAILKINKN